MIYRPNGARRTRHFLSVVLTHRQVELGWEAFQLVRLICFREGVFFDSRLYRLELRRTTTTPVGITALFEVTS